MKLLESAGDSRDFKEISNAVKISVLQMIVMKPNYKLFCESSPFGSKLKLMDAKRVKSSGCAEKRNLPRGKKNSAQRKGGNAGIINLN